MNIENWNARKLDRFREALDLELHDEECEQRERSSLCHCSKRRREAAGFTEPPHIEFHAPCCGRCGNEVHFDADYFRCDTCSTTWSTRASDGDRGTFNDDHGAPENFGGEQFGRRLVEIVRGKPW